MGLRRPYPGRVLERYLPYPMLPWLHLPWQFFPEHNSTAKEYPIGLVSCKLISARIFFVGPLEDVDGVVERSRIRDRSARVRKNRDRIMSTAEVIVINDAGFLVLLLLSAC